MIHKKSKGFTLVELVVVATILAILGAVGFSAYTGYISGARDSNRIAQLASIHDGLNIFTAKASLPLPDESIDVEINGGLIAYQGYAGANVLETIGYKKGGKDPKDDQYFSYYLDKKKNHFQLMAFLEEQESKTTFALPGRTVNANVYVDRYPSVYGQELGILTDEFNTPVQELETIVDVGFLNVGNTTQTFKAHISETKIITGTADQLVAIQPNTSCERIKQVTGSSESAYYTIQPLGDGVKYRIFCNMNGERVNMLSDDWTLGNGSVGIYGRNGDILENVREMGTNPIGETKIIWKAVPDSANNGDGGWNTSTFPIDNTKTYRVSSWFRKTGNTNGHTYLGALGNIARLNDTPDGNPYFWVGDLPTLDTWYLVVGYIHPESYSGTETKGGIYSTDSFEKIVNTTYDFKSLSTTATGRHRAYLFYNTDTGNRQYFYNPRYEEIPANKVGDVSDLLPVRLN